MPDSRELKLPDGRSVVIRPIDENDKDAIADAFNHLSSESRYRRFLAPQKELSAAELGYLTEVDHRGHEALVAVDPASGDIVGVARYVRIAHHGDRAELAVAVVDDWQEDRLGTALVEALATRARAVGVTHFVALVLAENGRMLRLLRDLGETRVVKREGGCTELVVDLPG